MKRNYASKFLPGALFAPVLAPIGGLEFFFSLQNTHISMFFFYAVGAIFVAYCYMFIVVAPLFHLTKARLRWSGPMVVVLGGVVPLLSHFIVVLLAYPPERLQTAVLYNEFPVFAGLFGAGLAVSCAYVIFQRLFTNRST